MNRSSLRFTAVLFALIGTLFVGTARAEIQKDGPQVWPGKVVIGVDPLGVQVGFSDHYYAGGAAAGYAAYKLGLNVAGLLAQPGNLSIWLGGEFNIGGRGNLAQLEPGIFVRLSFERFLHIPLVPEVQAGFSFPINVPYGYDGTFVIGGFGFKVGGGVYYYLTKNIGLGGETHINLGGAFYHYGGVSYSGFAGYWDFLTGARFAF